MPDTLVAASLTGSVGQNTSDPNCNTSSQTPDNLFANRCAGGVARIRDFPANAVQLALRTRVAQLAGVARIVPGSDCYRRVEFAPTSSQSAVVVRRDGGVHNADYDSAVLFELAHPVLEANPGGWSRRLKWPGCAGASSAPFMNTSGNNRTQRTRDDNCISCRESIPRVADSRR
jgi:hypothetical protein